MKLNSFKRKVFIFMIIFIVLPSIIINIISFYTAVGNIEKEISISNFEKLKLAENTLKQLESNILKDSFRLSINSSINKLNNLSKKIDLSNSKDIETVSHILDTLSDLVAVNSEYRSLYIYLDDFNYTFTSNIGVVANDFFKDSSWLKYYAEHKSKKALLTMPKSESNNAITYIYPLELSTNLKGALIINVKEEMVGSIINSSNYNAEEYIFIINDNGQAVTYPKANFLPSDILLGNYLEEIIQNQAPQGYITKTIGAHQLLACYLKSDLNNWNFISVSSAVSLVNKVNEIKKIIVFRTLVIVTLEIVAIILLSVKLARILSKYTLNNKIEESTLLILFNALLNKERFTSEPFEKSISIEKDSYLKNLIYHNYNINETDRAKIADIFKFNMFLCVVITIDKHDDFATLGFEMKKNIKDFINNKADEVLKEVLTFASLEWTNNELIIIINTEEEKFNNVFQEKLKNLFDKINEESKNKYTITITTGIGSLKYDISEIRQSYLEAQKAVMQKFKLGYGNTVFWKESLKKSIYYYPVKMEERLLNYLNTQSEDSITLSLNELIDDLTGRSNLTCENIKRIFDQLVGNTIVKYFQERKTDIHEVFGEGFNVYAELSRKETIYDVKDWLQDVYVKIIQNYSISNSKNNTLDLIIKYISDNYKRDIGIDEISQAVGISYSHLRKVFKDEVGENIVDYINAMRIKDAKKLLADTDICIKNIAVDVGYNNNQSFARFFKKYEGVTPGEYRNSKRLIKLTDEEAF